MIQAYRHPMLDPPHCKQDIYRESGERIEAEAVMSSQKLFAMLRAQRGNPRGWLPSSLVPTLCVGMHTALA